MYICNFVLICILLLFIYMLAVVDQLPRLGKRELICLLLLSCNYVVSVWRGFLFLCVLGMGYVIPLWHSLSLQYDYIACFPLRPRGQDLVIVTFYSSYTHSFFAISLRHIVNK